MNVVINTDNGDTFYLLPFLRQIYEKYGSCGYIFSISDPDATTHYTKKKNLLYKILYEQPYITKFGFVNKSFNRGYFYQNKYILEMQDLPDISEVYFEKNNIETLDDTLMNCGTKGVKSLFQSPKVDFVPNFYFHPSDTSTYIKPLSQLAVDRFGIGTCFNERYLHLNSHESLHDKKIAIGRSARYNENNDIMKLLVDKLGKENFVFLGLSDEYKSFCENVATVEYLETKDLLEVAQALNTVDLYIGNQSCIMAIAESLKLNIIQESSKRVPNCNFSKYRDNFYCVVKDNDEIVFVNDSLNVDNKDFFGIQLEKRPADYNFTVGDHKYPSKCYRIVQ